MERAAQHCRALPMIAAFNFFELAVAVAIGLSSGAAPATAVGALVEGPVMLSLVAYANPTRDRFPASWPDRDMARRRNLSDGVSALGLPMPQSGAG